MTLRRRAGLCLLLLTLPFVACGDEENPPPLARFNQPNRVDFVCVAEDEPVRLDHCQNDVPSDSVALHALVTQSARGEVAALNIDSQRVLDARRDIPGFTITPVGEMPVAVVVPPRHPERTYVADYGSRDVRVLATRGLVAALEINPTLQVLRLSLDDSGALSVLADGEEPTGTVIAPTDMALVPDESALVAAAPDVGLVIWLPIQRCRAGDADCRDGLIDEARVMAVPLQGSIDLALSAVPEPAPENEYELVCSFEPRQPPPIEPPTLSDEVAATTSPRPTALAIDSDCPDDGPCTPRVLVADEALPLIHALDLDALAAGDDPETAVLPPLVTNAPTLAVVVTPWVPTVVAEDAGETQFVYAIDARDGSVMALENGRLLSVDADPSGRPDRIGYGTQAGATALAVVTPDFDVREGAQQWLSASQCPAPEARDPALLHGVFLTSAHTDGTVRFVDVHDMELLRCPACPNVDVPLPVVIRHQPRIDRNFVTGEDAEMLEASPVSEPQFIADGTAFSVRANGTTGNPDVPGLDCIACDQELVRAFPPEQEQDDDGADVASDADAGTAEVAGACTTDAPALVCGDPDPFTGSGETWTAVYEGLIPGTIGGQGRFIPEGSPESTTGALELSAEIDFCAAGVLGEDDRAPWFEDLSCGPETDEFFLDACDCAPASEDASTIAERCALQFDRSATGDRGFGCVDGDQLVLTLRRLPQDVIDRLADEDEATAQRCRDLRDALQEDDAVPIGFEIRRAYRDRLVLRSRLTHPPLQVEGVSTFEDIEPCLASGLLSFEVRTLNEFVVSSSQTGFRHRVRANSAGRCVVDEAQDPLLQGRAQFGCTYRGEGVEFRVHRPQGGELTPNPGTALRIGVGSPATKLRVNVASSGFGSVNVIATELRYNPVDGQLYLVDVHRRGLVPIQLDPVLDFVSASFN
jgi:hypothetical protein